MYKRESVLYWRHEIRAFIAEAPVPLTERLPKPLRLCR